jgi:hypothetical protein
MPKMALADCSGLGDEVIVRTSLLEICHAVVPFYRTFRWNGALIWRKSASSTDAGGEAAPGGRLVSTRSGGANDTKNIF